MREELPPSWAEALAGKAAEIRAVMEKVAAARAEGTVYPPEGMVFEAFRRTPFGSVKAVILGQDPYHGEGQAHGLAFSVPEGVKAPPSLRNIRKELDAEFGGRERSGTLEAWADQGVLLLNATLTVGAGAPGSHAKFGWSAVTSAALEAVSGRLENVVFILWGESARKARALVDGARHLVLESAHPSPLSARRGFFGCGHFRAANAYLEAHGKTPVDW